MTRKSNPQAQNAVILETIVTTVGLDGRAHIAPIGVHVHAQGLVIAPFQPSRTLENLRASGVAVVNFCDDVRVFAGCLTGRRDWPLLDANQVPGKRLADTAGHREVKVVHIEDNLLRPRFVCKTVFEQNHRPFSGFNRAQAAVIEAAILVSRLDRLPRSRIELELDYLRVAIDKTAGPNERIAWDWLIEKCESHFDQTPGG